MLRSRTQLLTHSRGFSSEMVTLGHAGGAAGSVHIQLGGVLKIAGAFVEVGRHRGVPGQLGVHLGQRCQPGSRSVRFAECDHAVEPSDWVVGEQQQFVVPLDDLYPVRFGGAVGVRVQGRDGCLRLVRCRDRVEQRPAGILDAARQIRCAQAAPASLLPKRSLHGLR